MQTLPVVPMVAMMCNAVGSSAPPRLTRLGDTAPQEGRVPAVRHPRPPKVSAHCGLVPLRGQLHNVTYDLTQSGSVVRTVLIEQSRQLDTGNFGGSVLHIGSGHTPVVVVEVDAPTEETVDELVIGKKSANPWRQWDGRT
jgi:hypothetical protein